MQFDVLGYLQVRYDDRTVALGSHQQRAVLAVLVVHAGEAVSIDRLIDELWGAAPPPHARKTVQVYISRLRKLLEGDEAAIVTHGHSYELCVDADDVDVQRFERLLDDGRRLLDGGAFEAAGAVLREALGLWRGPALADFTYEPFAAREIARLEELRLEALELRVDADLALGRHGALVAELEALCSEHPLRERLCAQRMLALYRCGRHSEALAVFRDMRARLVGELGLEPSARLRELHEAMLRQDPTLDLSVTREAPGGSPRPADARRGTRRRRRAAVAVALAACAGTLAAVVVLVKGGGAGATAVAANTVAVIDPDSGRMLDDIPVGVRPRDVIAGAGGVWVANLTDATITRIDPATDQVIRTIAPGGSLAGLAVGAGRVWAVNGMGDTLSRIDPSFSSVDRLSMKPVRNPFTLPFEQVPVLATGRMVWFADDGVPRIVGVDPVGDRVRARIDPGFYPSAIAVGAGAMWIADALGGSITRIDRAGARHPIPVGGEPRALAVGAGGVWVADAVDGAVERLDAASGAVRATINVGGRPAALAVDRGAVWVATGSGRALVRIDARTNRVTRRLLFDQGPAGVAVAGGRLWITLQAAPAALKPAPGRVRVAVQEEDTTTDPALNYGHASWQVAYATCAFLMNYPDQAGAPGTRLVPELAARPPAVSRDGDTYTFTIRPGWRFSPPSGAALTAATVKHTFERAFDPRLGSEAAAYLDDIVGERAFIAGHAAHVAGIVARGRRLTFHLTRRTPDFLAKTAMPYFCTVPDQTPARRGLDDVAAAGPYYIAAHTRGQLLQLRRNPNYHGPRPRRPTEIDVLYPGRRAPLQHLVTSGAADDADGLQGGTPARRRDDPRLFAAPTLSLRFIRLNAHRPLFASARMRRAVNYAVDRAALATVPDLPLRRTPTDQYIPPGMPGYHDARIYPLHGPDLATARRLAGRGHHRAVLYTGNQPEFDEQAAILRRNLAAIGIDLDVHELGPQDAFKRLAAGGWDLALLNGWLDDYDDPSEYLNMLFEPGGPVDFGIATPPALAARLRAAAQHDPGPARWRAYAQLDATLARHHAPFIAYANDLWQDYFSPRIGCQLQHPVYGIDLGALCQRPHQDQP